jgi:hypothetical protein
MLSKRIEIFTKVAISLKMSIKCHAFFKKRLSILKNKSLMIIAALPQWPFCL